MMVVGGGPGGRDPLARAGGLMLAVVLAFIVSVFAAALLASQLPGGYRARALGYLALVLWVLSGSVLLFRATYVRGEPGPFRIARVAAWTVSIWLWPLLLLGRRRDRRS